MGLILKTYNLSAVVCTVGSVIVGGYGADGGLEVEWSADIGEISHGATGLTTFSRNNNSDATITITVMETSATYAALAAQMKVQENTPFVITPLPFFMRDNITGDQLSTATSVYIQRPAMSKGRVAGERQFKIHLPGASITAIYGAQNVL